MSSDNLTHDEQAQTDETPSAAALNEAALVGLAADEDELSWRYKSALAPDSFKPHGECVEIDNEYYTRTLEVRDWPNNPQHGFFDRIISFQMPTVAVTLTTHFEGEDDREADRSLASSAESLQQRVKSLARNKHIPDYFVSKAADEYADVKRTQNTVAGSEYGLYTVHTYIELRSPDRDALNTAVKRVRSRMQDVSADARPLNHHAQLGYETVAPAGKNYLGGETKMTGEGLSRLIPWTAENLIEPGGIELGTNEDTGDPIILDLQNRETGFNIGIWGTIGAGKTTTLTRLLMRLKMKNPEMPVVIIDPKQEFSGLTWLFDGETVKIGTDTGINPLQIEEIPPEDLDDDSDQSPKRNAVRRAMDFARSFYEYQGLSSVWEDVQGTWRDAITEAYLRRGITDNPATHSNDSPTLKDDVFPIFAEMVKMPENFLETALADVEQSQDRMQNRADEIIHNHISALQEGGEFEHLSMETSIDIQNIDVLYLDLQNYENEVTAGLMMGPVLTAVLEQAKKVDEPMALAMDEFHYMLQNSSSLETLKQAYRHSRHSDLSLITATQSVEEFFTRNEEGEQQLTEDASTLTNLMSVKIWHYLKEMDDQWASEFDLSEAEKKYIQDADTGDPTAQALLELQKGGSYRLSVDFSDKLNPREFAMNKYDPTESEHGTDPLAYLDSYTNRDGRDVTAWTWSEPDQAAPRSGDEQAHTGTELADGTTITADVADVDVTPTDDTASSEQDPTESRDGGTETPDTDTDTPTDTDTEAGGETNPAESGDEGADLSLTDIGTVTARTASDLRAGGFETVESVAAAENRSLGEIEGFDEKKAEFIREQAVDAIENASERSQSDGIGERLKDVMNSAVGRSDESGDGIDDEDEQPDLEDIHGTITARTAGKLRRAGFETVEAVYEADNTALAETEDIDVSKAAFIRRNAAETLGRPSSVVESPEASEQSTSTHSSNKNADGESDEDPAATVDSDELESAVERVESADHQPTEAQASEKSDGAENAETAEQSPESTDASQSNQPVLTDIQEVGSDRADVLREAGFESVEDVATVEQDTLAEVKGIGGARAETITASATDLLGEDMGSEQEEKS